MVGVAGNASPKRGSLSWLSAIYMTVANPHCLIFERQWILLALSLALLSAGKSSAAKMAIMAMTTSSSIKVNPGEATRRQRIGAVLRIVRATRHRKGFLMDCKPWQWVICLQETLVSHEWPREFAPP